MKKVLFSLLIITLLSGCDFSLKENVNDYQEENNNQTSEDNNNSNQNNNSNLENEVKKIATAIDNYCNDEANKIQMGTLKKENSYCLSTNKITSNLNKIVETNINKNDIGLLEMNDNKVTKLMILIDKIMYTYLNGEVTYTDMSQYLDAVEDAKTSAIKSEINLIVSSVKNYCLTEQYKVNNNTIKEQDRICKDSNTIKNNIKKIVSSLSLISLDNISEIKMNNNEVTKLVVKAQGYIFTYQNNKITYVKDTTIKDENNEENNNSNLEFEEEIEDIKLMASGISNYCVTEDLGIKLGTIKEKDRYCSTTTNILSNFDKILDMKYTKDNIITLKLDDNKVTKLVVKKEGYIFTYENDKVIYVKE